jgi:hypothetical protein
MVIAKRATVSATVQGLSFVTIPSLTEIPVLTELPPRTEDLKIVNRAAFGWDQPVAACGVP